MFRKHNVFLPLLLSTLTAAAVSTGMTQTVYQRTPVRDANTFQTGKTRELQRSPAPLTPLQASPPRTAQRAQRSGLRDIMDEQTEAIIRKWGDAYKNADTLQYTSVSTYQPRTRREKAQKITLKFCGQKPNFIRAEVETPNSQENGVMVSDGHTIWEYCPAQKLYAITPVPEGPFLMQGELFGLRYVAPSMLYHPDPFSALIANSRAIRIEGKEKLEDEDCVVVSRQMARSVSVVWLSEKDYLPRLSISYELQNNRPVETFREVRSEVAVDETITKSTFKFRPPQGAKRHVFPRAEDVLLKPGTAVPDFKAANADEAPVQFSSLKGKTVVLIFWSYFCPVCRAEMEVLNKLQTEFADKNVVILGVNMDYAASVKDYLAEKPGTKVKLWRDPTEGREKTSPFALCGVRGIPTTYLIDKEGKVVTSWLSYEDKKADELHEAIKNQIEK